MPLKPIAAPGVEPVSLATAKAHLRLDENTEDTLVSALIVAARQAAEARIGRALISQTWELILDAFPATEIKLGLPPVVSIASVKYVDADGVERTLDASNYTLDADTAPGWLLPAWGAEWPATRDVANAVRIRFVTGYGAAESDVPAAIRQWLLVTIGTLYANREATAPGQHTEVPRSFVDGLLDPYRVMEVG